MAAYTRRIIALALAGAIHAFDRSVAADSAPLSAPLPDVVRHLVGTWKSAEDKIPRGTPLDEQVFGRGAFAVRNVTLAIRPTGEGTLRVHTAIIGHNGKVFVPELIDVRIGLAGPLAPVPNRFEPTVSVVAAMKRELDPPYDRWSIEGARLVIDLPAIASPELNVQFDTRDGRDGFGGTLTRQN